MRKDIRKHVLSIVFVSIFLVLVTTFVYMPNHNTLVSAMAFLRNEQSFYMEDVTSGLLLKDSVPMEDSKGLSIDPYTFRVVNNTNHNITYKIVFKNNKEKALASNLEVLDNKYLRYSISNTNDTDLEAKTLNDDCVLATYTALPLSKQEFNFRMWLDYNSDSEAMGKIFIGSLEVVEVK